MNTSEGGGTPQRPKERRHHDQTPDHEARDGGKAPDHGKARGPEPRGPRPENGWCPRRPEESRGDKPPERAADGVVASRPAGRADRAVAWLPQQTGGGLSGVPAGEAGAKARVPGGVANSGAEGRRSAVPPDTSDGAGRARLPERVRALGRGVPAFLRNLTLRTGLRWKLSAAIAMVSALVALALSLVVHNAARVSMLDSARDVQDERIQFAQRIYETTGRRQFNTKIDDPKIPQQLRRKAEAGRRATFVSQSSGSRGDTPDIWAAVPLKDGHVLSLHTRFTERSAAVMRDLDQALTIGSIAAVLGGCALGVLIGGQLSRRLRKAAVAAGQVAQGQTDVRVREAVGGVVRDETDDLARSVDAMADALKQRLEAERRVTADIAHELRTPVTGLLTAAELLPPGRPSELVKDRAQAMRTLVEDVLEVARLDSAAERAELQDITLGEFVSRRVALLNREVTVDVVRESEVTTDPRRLERILGNLLANAVGHGRGPVGVAVDGRVIRVRDHGPGFPEELLKDGPSRFRIGSSARAGRGHGLGLTIAAGQARVLGARLTFRNVREPMPWTPDGGPADAVTAARAGSSGHTAGPSGAPVDGAMAVLWLPEHAPTSTGSFPVLRLPGD